VIDKEISLFCGGVGLSGLRPALVDLISFIIPASNIMIELFLDTVYLLLAGSGSLMATSI